MSNQYLKLRRSGVPGKIPSTSSIDYGEIALNTYDGIAYMKKSGSNGEEVVPIGSNSGSFSGSFIGDFTGSLYGTASWSENAITASYYDETDPIFTAVSGTFTTTASFNIFTSSYYQDSASFDTRIIGNSSSISLLSSSFVSFRSSYNTGSFTGSFTGSLFGTSSWAANAESSSYALNSTTASFVNYISSSVGTEYSIIRANNTKYLFTTYEATSNNQHLYINSRHAFWTGSSIASRLIGQMVAIGGNSLESAGIDGSTRASVALGAIALRRLRVGEYNVGIGPWALEYLTNGQRNTAVGQDAGGGVSTGSFNTFLGAEAGYANNASSTQNNMIVIGYRAQYTASSPTNNISNTTVIGNELNTSLSNVVLLGRSDQNVIIGNSFSSLINSDPGYKLSVLGSGNFTSLVNITGSLTVLGGITGSLFGTSSWAQNALTASNILGGKATHVPFFNTDTTLATSSIYQSGSSTVIINQDAATEANPEALYVWQPSTSSFNVISGKGNLDNYLQLNIQNTNQGPNASSDVVATANNGSETDNYIDMGINSENYAGFLGDANDSYLYSHGHDMWIGNINDGHDLKFFNSSSVAPILTLTSDQTVNVNTVLNSPNITGSLHGTASWALNTVSSSHAVNADFAGYATTAGIATNGGVTQLIAGSGVTLLPSTGVGAVTVIASAGGGVTIISGSLVTGSFTNATSYTFNHNLNTRTPIITVFDTNYNQVIPENIYLLDSSSAVITFPTPESGFAIGSTGGTTGTALSSSYALFATYADTASFYQETDPVFVARSASLATTGSNLFRGNQTITGSVTITGSLTVSGSNTFTKIGPSIFSGSVTLVNGATGSLFGTASLALTASYTLSSSFASTSSYVNPLFQNVLLTGSLLLTQSYISTVDYIDFTTTSTPAHLEGRIHWDVDTKTLQIDTDVNNFAIPTGHTNVLRGKNQNNFTLTKGRVVYISGEQGNTPTFATASWDNEVDSAYAIAIIAQDINSNNNGYAVTNGILTGINTNAYPPSTLLYLSSSGQYTNVKPTAPKQGVRLGQVITQAINGSIYVKVDNGYEIGELHDVVDTTTTSSFGDLLVKSGSIWINTKQLTGSYAVTGSLTISGSGTFTNIGPAAFTGSVGVTGSVTMAGNIVPTVSSSFSLGSITNPWKEIFLKSGSISMESDIPGAPPTTLSNVDGNILVSAGGMQLVGSGSFNATTGSFGYISGSLTQVGNHTKVGNTVITGSFTVSGSATFNDGFFVNGNKQYNYGQFSSTASQSGSINVTSSFNYDTTQYSNGVSVVSGSRITVTNGGIYNIAASTTVNITTNVTTNVYLWLRKNGSNVANSAVFFQGRASYHYLTLNHIVNASAGDYFEVMKMYDADSPIFTAVVAAGGLPTVPSITTTVTQIA